MMLVRRKKLVLALAVGLLAAPLLVLLVVPQAHLRLYAVVLAKRLGSKEKDVRERTRKKLLELGRPAIDGVLPELVASAVAENPQLLVFAGEARSVEGSYVFYDILEILPDDPQHPRKGEHPFTPGIRLEWKGDEDALRSRRLGPKLVMAAANFEALLSVDLDDPAVGARVVGVVSAKLREPEVQDLRRRIQEEIEAARKFHKRR